MQQSLLARRYAQAYLNIFGQKYTHEHSMLIAPLMYYMRTHKEALFYLKLSCIKSSVKKNILSKMFAAYGLKDDFDTLLDVLIKHKRLFMLSEVLYCIAQLYKKRNNIIEWTVKSASLMQPEDLEIVYHFLEKKTGMHAEYTYKTDPTLLAGIRLQSNTYLWQHSIRRQLDAMKLPLIR